MKQKILKKILIILMLVIQILQISGNFLYSEATIKEGDFVVLQADHECDSVLEYWMEDFKKWSYKIVWYVYYIDKEDNNKYPAFCIEPQKEGVGTGYESYEALVKEENRNSIWRILNKGYMGSTYQEWNLECDDDLYSATKVALHSIAEQIEPKAKYVLGNRSVDGNTVEEIRRRGEKVLNVAQSLYEYGINGTETYVSPKINITKVEEAKIEKIGDISYYIQDYKVTANKYLKSYQVEIQNFPIGTKILNIQNQEQFELSNNLFKIAIPIEKIKQDINGTIKIKDAKIKTNPIFYCQSSIKEAQSYVTYTNGYEIADTSTTFELKANNANLKIEKIDKETKLPIANVTFEILDENRNKIIEVTTNEKGIANLSNLYPQTVIIKEIKVPDKYVLSNEEKKIELEFGKVSSITFENEKKKGNLKIVKVDKDNNEIKLENVEFKLLDSNKKVVDTIVTNKNGEAYIKNLEIGTYTLKETKTNKEYNLSEDRKIEIKWNKTKVEKIENEKKKGQIEIYKTDKENSKQKLEGVVFEILDKNKQRIETIITNKDGYAISSNLPIGNYFLKEIKTNNKYILSNDILKVEIKDKDITTIIVENEKKKGQIEVYKVDKDNNQIKLENVEFEIIDNNNKVVGKIKTNKEGYAISSKLPIGEYYIKEIKTNDKYVLDEEKIKVEVEYGKIKTLKLTNEKIKGKIQILKISKDNNLINGNKKGMPIESVEFEIRNKNGEVVEKLVTSKDGIATSSRLEIGTYIIKEIKAHKDYHISDKEYKVEILENEKIEQITITNISKEPPKPEEPKLPRTGF